MIEGDLFDDAGRRDKVSIKSILSDYLPYWWLFMLGILLCVSVAFFWVRYTVPEYYVSTTILIKDEEDASALTSTSALVDMDMLKPSNNIDDEIIVLKSKSLMERVLTELSLNATYFVEGRVQDIEVYGKDVGLKVHVSELHPSGNGKKLIIYPRDNESFELGETNAEGNVVKSTYKFGEQIHKPYAVFSVLDSAQSAHFQTDKNHIVVFHDIKKLASYYSNKLEVNPVNKKSNVLSLSLTDPVYEKSLDILNKLVEAYEIEAVEDKNMLASNALSFIDDRLRYLSAELTNVEKNVELYKIQNDLTDVSSEAELYLKSADTYNKQLSEYEIQIELLKSIKDYLKKQGDQFELVPSSLNIQDPTLLVLISKFNELQLERQRMLRTTRPDNPLILNLNDQLSTLKANIGENIDNIMNGLIITRDKLVRNSAKFTYRKKKVPAMERELLEINRQQGVKEGLYLYLLQKREESALSLAATVSNFRIIDPPSVIYPIYPNKPFIYLVAILLGLAGPFTLIYIKNILNDKVTQIKDIERATRTPILGEIARNRTKQFLVVSKDATSPIVEMLRLIRTNLQFATIGRENKVILVTSSISGEGKSFFSINLAASLVLTGKKVVVVGLDLRKPALLRAVDLSDGLGVTNYLISDRVSIADIIRPSNVLPNLFVITSGPVLPSPTELMMGPKMAELFDALRASFDHIIIDSAPVGLVADALTLAPFLDSTVYVMRSNYTPKDRIAVIDKIYRENRLKCPMIVLNDINVGKGHKYGYGYYEKKHRKNHEPVSKKVMPQNEVASVK